MAQMAKTLSDKEAGFGEQKKSIPLRVGAKKF
jgi:hypothetical protein